MNILWYQNALLGGLFGVAAMSWISLNAQWAIASGAIKYEHKEMSIWNCTYDFDLVSEVGTSGFIEQEPYVIDISRNKFQISSILLVQYTGDFLSLQ